MVKKLWELSDPLFIFYYIFPLFLYDGRQKGKIAKSVWGMEWNDVNERMISILAVNVCQSLLVNMSGQPLSFTVSALAPKLSNNRNSPLCVLVLSSSRLFPVLRGKKWTEIFFLPSWTNFNFPVNKVDTFLSGPEWPDSCHVVAISPKREREREREIFTGFHLHHPRSRPTRNQFNSYHLSGRAS